MSLLLAIVFNTALIFLEDVMLLIFVNGFFRREKSRSFLLITFLIMSAISCVIVFFFGNYVALKYFLLFIPSSSWVFLSYNVSIIKSAFPVAFWLAYLTIMDNAVITLISALMGADAQQLLSTIGSYYLIFFTAKITEFLGAIILYSWLKRHFLQGYSTIIDWLRVLVFPVLTLLVSSLLLKIYYLDPAMSYELTICNAIILVLDVMSIFILIFLEKQQEAVRDNVILRQSMKAEIDNVEAWRKAYDGQRRQTHDFQNQLSVIYGLVNENAPNSEVLTYIKRLQNIDLPTSMIIKTHRTAVDIILSQKSAIAENLSIRFNTQLDDLSDFPLPDDALIVVLANLIDNAIEACTKIPCVDDRNILLKIKVEPQAAFIYIENSTASPVQIQNDHIVTTKKDPVEHGYGLQNITFVLERHKAIYAINYSHETHRFSFSAQIPAD